MDYHLPNMDNRGHLANYHLPQFVHVVIKWPLRGLAARRRMCFVIHHQHEITCDQGKQNESGLRGILPYFVFEQIILLHRYIFGDVVFYVLKFIYSEKAKKVKIKSKWEMF